jgi:hypothetical protein
MSQTATVMAKFCSAPVPRMAANARKTGRAGPAGPPPDDVAADQEAVQNPGASVSLGTGPRRRCRGPFSLNAPDDLRCLG